MLQRQRLRADAQKNIPVLKRRRRHRIFPVRPTPADDDPAGDVQEGRRGETPRPARLWISGIEDPQRVPGVTMLNLSATLPLYPYAEGTFRGR